MYYSEYMWFLLAIVACMILSVWASGKVKSSFMKHNGVRCRSGLTGAEAVSRLLRAGGVYDVSIGRVGGFLSDHYHPKHGVVNLSDSTYQNSSVAAVAVAAHEVGHVMQKKDGYAFYKARTALVPVVNFGSFLAMPLVLIGLLMDYFVATASGNVGFYVATPAIAT